MDRDPGLEWFRIAPILVMLVPIFGIMHGAAAAIVPIHLANQGMSQDLAAVFVTVQHIGMIVSQPVLGVILDRLDRWTVSIGCLMATGISLFALKSVSISNILIWPITVVSGTALFGVYITALSLLGRHHRGSVLLFTSLQGGGADATFCCPRTVTLARRQNHFDILIVSREMRRKF